MTKHDVLMNMYKGMSETQIQEEIDAIFEIIFAILESQECDKISSYPNPNIELSFSCKIINDESNFMN